MKQLPIVLVGVFLMAAQLVFAVTAEMPVGVYLSWELAHAYAELNQIPLEDFLDNSLELCEKRGVNTLWVTNIDVSGTEFLLKICSRHKIQLVANACEGKNAWLYNEESAALQQAVAKMDEVTDAGLLGWIISDEPEGRHVDDLVKYSALLEKSANRRLTGLVVTHAQFREVIGKVPLDMAAIDPYPFFGPNDPNGPNHREASQAHFRTNGERFVDLCRKVGTIPWQMPQSFAEVWGPYHYDEDGRLIAEKGSYLHWRTPTLAEMRWQLFESLRQGAQGIIFFQLFPTMVPAAGRNPMPDVPWKDVLMKEETSAGYAALLTIAGKPTPEFDELGRYFPIIRRNSAMLLKSRPAEMPSWLSGCPANVKAAAFRSEGAEQPYVVLVNDDFENSVTIKISGKGLVDMNTGRKVGKKLTLRPGGGMVLMPGK